MNPAKAIRDHCRQVSMKSGLEGRNNEAMGRVCSAGIGEVSMKSGLEGRNNPVLTVVVVLSVVVSMKSGLEGRNNRISMILRPLRNHCLNEVRPRRPEQSAGRIDRLNTEYTVSMKSGLEGRNNGDTWLDYAPVFIASQ